MKSTEEEKIHESQKSPSVRACLLTVIFGRVSVLSVLSLLKNEGVRGKRKKNRRHSGAPSACPFDLATNWPLGGILHGRRGWKRTHAGKQQKHAGSRSPRNTTGHGGT